FDRELESRLTDFRAMRPAERGILEILRIPAGALGTGAGGEMRHIGPQSGLRCSHDLSFQIASLPLGGGVPPPEIWQLLRRVKSICGHHGRLMEGDFIFLPIF